MPNKRTKTPPDLPAIFRALLRAAKMSINCVQIGTIEAFDPANQTATIKISMKIVEKTDNDGNTVLKDYPLLLESPVFVLQGGDDHITFPIKKGDNCIILFNDRQIDQWLNLGDGLPPAVGRVHDISDGMALVGVRPFPKSLLDYFEGGIRINHADSAKIELSDDLIESTAALLKHNGNAEITQDTKIGGNLTIDGQVYGMGGPGGSITFDADINQVSGREIHAGNGANGTFDVVTVVNGIVISGS